MIFTFKDSAYKLQYYRAIILLSSDRLRDSALDRDTAAANNYVIIMEEKERKIERRKNRTP